MKFRGSLISDTKVFPTTFSDISEQYNSNSLIRYSKIFAGRNYFKLFNIHRNYFTPRMDMKQYVNRKILSIPLNNLIYKIRLWDRDDPFMTKVFYKLIEPFGGVMPVLLSEKSRRLTLEDISR